MADPREQSLTDRYGARSPAGRIGWLLGVTALAVAFLAWVVWAALDSAPPGYGAKLHSYEVISEHEVQVTLDARRAANRPLACTVTAQAEDHSVVGETEVEIPPGAAGDITVTASVKTDREATTALVSGCH